MGKKDLEIYEKAKKDSIGFIDQLNEKGFLKKYITLEEDALTKKVLDRVNLENASLMKLEKLIISGRFDDFVESAKVFSISKQDVMNYIKDGVGLPALESKDIANYLEILKNRRLKINIEAYSKYIEKMAYKIDGKVADHLLNFFS